MADYLWTFFLSVIPVSEIRGSMIYAFAHIDGGFYKLLAAYLISVFGNFLPVPFIMLVFRPIVKWLKKTKLFGGLAHRIEKRTHKKALKLKKVSASALLVFVAIPFPTTGAWTGAMIASLLDIRFKYALPAILGGIVISGCIMTLLLTGILNLGGLGRLFIS